MKAILHIGTPKTGSSSIQDFLYENHNLLAERGVRFHRNVTDRGSQWEYPLAVMAQNGVLPRGEMEQARYGARSPEEALSHTENYLRELDDFANRWKEPVAVFSSEHIWSWLNTPELVRAFDAVFSKVFTEVKYLVYIRDPADLIVSQYSERTKRGYSFTLDEFIEVRLKGLGNFKPARRWANAVGKDRMTVKVMDRSLLKDGDLIADFCDFCGVDSTGLTPPPRVNESLTAPAAECLRVLNASVPELRPDGSENPLRAGLLEEIEKLSANMPALRVNAAQQQRLDEHLAESDEKLRKMFFFQQAALYPRPSTRSPAASPAEIHDLSLRLMAQLLIKTRMGDFSVLDVPQREGAYLTAPAGQTETANTATAPTEAIRTTSGGQGE